MLKESDSIIIEFLIGFISGVMIAMAIIVLVFVLRCVY